MVEKFKEAFREEAAELLATLEDTLLELEDHPQDKEAISAVFRVMHTIKGSSAMFGFDAVSRFTHEVESVMDLLREGAFIADRALIDLTLRARDLITAMLAPGGGDYHEEADSLIGAFKAHVKERVTAREAAISEEEGYAPPPQPPQSVDAVPQASDAGTREEEADGPPTGDATPKADTPAPAGPESGTPQSYTILWRPGSDLFRSGTKPRLLLEELASLGSCVIEVLTDRIPALSELDPESCLLGWRAKLLTDKGLDAVKDVFIFVEGSGELSIEAVPLAEAQPSEESPRLGEILVQRGITTADRIETIVKDQKRLGEMLVREGVATSVQVRSALQEQEQQKRIKEIRQQELTSSSVRVASEKLDALVDLVGELVTLQARLTRTAQDLGDGGLSSMAEQFERLVAQLRDNAMSIRMLPIGTTFSKFRRLLRDLSRDLGKEIDLATEGAETELDKTVIERLNDPLVHIIRNSVDHGIELPEARSAAGKNRTGTVTLSARHSGAHVLIQVSDDGGGLDQERILAKAVEKGVVPPGTNLSEQEIQQLIFAPGFSTAAAVTSVSGRGVGMDVVKREIDSLGGSVSVSSRRGQGTTVSLKIPLTLAIIEGLLVRIGADFFVVPLSSVEGCLELRSREVGKEGRRVLSYRDELLPYASLRDFFFYEDEAPEIEQIVVVNAQDFRMGLVVDSVVGDYQTVIKPLGRMFKGTEGLSGATILGDGNVALILDVNKLAESIRGEEQRRTASEALRVSAGA